jgi:hypothetical protein
MTAAKHAAPKPSPYSIAVGAVAYSLAVTFHRYIPVDLIASAPAAVTAAVAAIERGIAREDPKAAPYVDRLAVQAAGAFRDLGPVITAALPAITQEIKPIA